MATGRRDRSAPGASDEDDEVVALRLALLRWYRRAKRDLPWRRTRDPYAIWIAEIMLQQTRVAVVEPYYTRFLERFPDVASLAAAEEDEVLAAWSGLGYYGRARALRRCAIEVTRRHAGRIPIEVEDLAKLPGIGRYTAGAVASQAYGKREPVLDGNVRRVLCRLYALRGKDAADPRLWILAERLVDAKRPGDWNQALMELGAVICTPRAPSCERCPVAERCGALALGTPEEFPPKKASIPATEVRVAVALVVRRGKVLLERPGPGNPLRGRWDLPAVEIGIRSDARALLEARLAERGIGARAGHEVARASHSILNRRLRLEVFAFRTVGEQARRGSLRWVLPAEMSDTPVSGATQKVLRAADALERQITGRSRPSPDP